MARSFTLAELRTRVRERADMESTNFISDAELDRFISASYTELHDLLVKADPSRYLREDSFTLTGTTTTVAMPFDYYGTINVLVELDSGNYAPVHKIMPGEITNWPREATSTSLLSYYNSRPQFGYRFLNNFSDDDLNDPEDQNAYSDVLQIFPRVSESTNFIHVYVRAPQIRDKDNGTIDGISGWEEYIVLDAAIKCLHKEETNAAHLERAKADMKARIEIMAENRTAAEAGHVADTGWYTNRGYGRNNNGGWY